MLNNSSERLSRDKLTKEIAVPGKYIIITGFEGVKIGDPPAFLRLIRERIEASYVQLFDGRLVAGWEHLYFASLNALRAFETGLNASKDPAVESLLYASGQHQIRKAVELLGVKPDVSKIAVLIIAETKEDADEALKTISELSQGRVNDEVLELTNEKAGAVKKLFNISDLEMEAASRGESPETPLINLVIEHVALAIKRR